MSVWGISVGLEGGEPVVTGMEVTGPRAAMTFKAAFQHRTDPNDDWPLKLRALGDALDTELRKGAPSAVVIRTMDWFAKRGEKVYRKRYGVDGALLAVLRRHVDRVDAKSGKEIAAVCGARKAEIEAEARAAFGADHVDEGMAAIAALVVAGEA